MIYNCNLNFDQALLSAVEWCRMHVLRKCYHMQWRIQDFSVLTTHVKNIKYITHFYSFYSWRIYFKTFKGNRQYHTPNILQNNMFGTPNLGISAPQKYPGSVTARVDFEKTTTSISSSSILLSFLENKFKNSINNDMKMLIQIAR